MDKITYIILILAIFGIVLRLVFNRLEYGEESVSKTKPRKSRRSLSFVENDKIIIVRHLKINVLKKVIEQFCDSYNQKETIAMPRLIVSQDEYIITFPFNIDFERFCYFINYLKYPIDIDVESDYRPELVAWCSTAMNDTWMTKQILNKRVMLFIPEWDTDYDNVYLTTEDNLGYKMGFARGEKPIKLKNPAMKYEVPPDKLKYIADQIIDF